jgi:AraC-like DNA-binding protein
MNSKYIEIKPRLKELKPLIKLYYFHQSDDENAIEKITYFPNYATTINVYKISTIISDSLSRTHENEVNNQYLKLLVGKIDKSREVIQKGAYNKVTIVFNPLGLNHFIDAPVSEIIEDHFSIFNYYGESFDKMLDKVFSTDNMESKGDLLDQFFLSKHIEFKDHRLTFAVDEILKSNGNISINSMANELNISRKTLLRLFKKHISISPTEFKSIVRFRKALTLYQSKTTKPNFSSIAHEAYFYDQSDLNFYFKKKTGLSPTQLFSVIKTIEKDLYWKVEYVPKVLDKKEIPE